MRASPQHSAKLQLLLASTGGENKFPNYLNNPIDTAKHFIISKSHNDQIKTLQDLRPCGILKLSFIPIVSLAIKLYC